MYSGYDERIEVYNSSLIKEYILYWWCFWQIIYPSKGINSRVSWFIVLNKLIHPSLRKL